MWTHKLCGYEPKHQGVPNHPVTPPLLLTWHSYIFFCLLAQTPASCRLPPIFLPFTPRLQSLPSSYQECDFHSRELSPSYLQSARLAVPPFLSALRCCKLQQAELLIPWRWGVIQKNSIETEGILMDTVQELHGRASVEVQGRRRRINILFRKLLKVPTEHHCS